MDAADGALSSLHDPHEANPWPDDSTLAGELVEPDYWEGRGLYLYCVHFNPRTDRFSPFEARTEVPLWPFPNVDMHKATEPKDGVQDADYLTFDADDFIAVH